MTTQKNSIPSRLSSHSESLTLITLGGVIVMLIVSLWNMWNMNRLATRIVAVEARLTAPAAAERGPDPKKVYTIEVGGAPTKGPDIAPITITEFADFQCPFCARVTPTLQKIEQAYKGQVRFVWKHYPLDIHSHAVNAALAAEAARNQGRFWEYHDKLFDNQKELTTDALKRYARELMLDVNRLEKDMAAADLQKKIDGDVKLAETLEVSVTPSFFINGRYVRGAQPYEVFEKIINEELTKKGLPIPPKTEAAKSPQTE